MNDPNEPLRLLVILARPDDQSFPASATAACYATDDVKVTLLVPDAGQRCYAHPTTPSSPRAVREVVALSEPTDTDQMICELVAHIRRLRPHVVITSGPWDAPGDVGPVEISQLATAAVMRAADPRYGHTCTSRNAHAVSKLYYTAKAGPTTTRINGGHQMSDTYYRVFSTVNRGPTLETDLFEGLRRTTAAMAVAA